MIIALELFEVKKRRSSYETDKRGRHANGWFEIILYIYSREING